MILAAITAGVFAGVGLFLTLCACLERGRDHSVWVLLAGTSLLGGFVTGALLWLSYLAAATGQLR